jgi:hypothetical protein
MVPFIPTDIARSATTIRTIGVTAAARADAPPTGVAWPRLRLPGHLLQSIRVGVVCMKPHG